MLLPAKCTWCGAIATASGTASKAESVAESISTCDALLLMPLFPSKALECAIDDSASKLIPFVVTVVVVVVIVVVVAVAAADIEDSKGDDDEEDDCGVNESIDAASSSISDNGY
ncbi:unnamed protein product [Gongylonema pulchrum]|uniref:Secreted protein n=1 Tax=Gongylonema pulchrum TaxID=637853 RepID=A0A183EF52_9BILA|nr:unnamed protein product [Gongylonema pulchrum]